MKTLVLQHIDQLPADLFAGNDIEKLVIRHSTVSLPPGIGEQKQLKELHLVGCTVGAIPAELLQLPHCFYFFERNEPVAVQCAAVVLFDVQWQKISAAQGALYLDLLQNGARSLAAVANEPLLQALDYRLAEVRSAALARLHQLPVADTIPAGSTICIKGKPTAFSVSDIMERLNTLGIKLADKPGADVTHVVVAGEPGWKGDLPMDKVLFTDQQFYQWLNTADELFLSADTDENKDARQNIADMLNSGDAANAALALQMLKTNGVSKELLTDLFLFYHATEDKSLKRKAKQVFKQHAPEPVISFLEANTHRYLGTMEVYTHFQEFINWAENTGHLDIVKIAARKKEYSSCLSYASVATSRALLLTMIEEGVLDLSDTSITHIPPGLLDELPIHTLINRGNRPAIIQHDVLLTLRQVEVLNLDNIQYRDFGLPEDLSQLTRLRELHLGTLDKFPYGVLTIPNLERLEIKQLQVEQFPQDAAWPATMHTIIVHSQYWEKMDEAKKERLESSVPAGCTVNYQVTEKK